MIINSSKPKSSCLSVNNALKQERNTICLLSQSHLRSSLTMQRIETKSSSALARHTFCQSYLSCRFLSTLSILPHLFQLCLSTLYISSIKLWSSTLCPFNVKLWFAKNLHWSKTWNLLATTRNSLHHYWVQPYWLESTEDPKISPIDLSQANLFGHHHFGKLKNRNICSPGFSICDCYCQNSCQQFKEKP